MKNQHNHQLLASYIESIINDVFTNKFQKYIIKQLLSDQKNIELTDTENSSKYETKSHDGESTI